MCKLIQIGDTLERRAIRARQDAIRKYVGGWAGVLGELSAERQRPHDFLVGLDQAISELSRWRDRWEEML